ncbi:CCHC-type domain-containing protein [Trichonephila clavipes]|nr:CCHC-type domain-containing protein [Trichonephila clavipes]
MADLKDLKGALVFAMKFEAAQQATRKDRHPIRAVNESDTSNSGVERLERQMRSFLNRVESLMSQKADGKKTLKCWTCGREGHLQRSCRARQGAETNKRLPEGGVGKLINGHPSWGGGCQILESPIFKCVKFRQRVPVRMEFL